MMNDEVDVVGTNQNRGAFVNGFYVVGQSEMNRHEFNGYFLKTIIQFSKFKTFELQHLIDFVLYSFRE